jgi:hypothetical protein
VLGGVVSGAPRPGRRPSSVGATADRETWIGEPPCAGEVSNAGVPDAAGVWVRAGVDELTCVRRLTSGRSAGVGTGTAGSARVSDLSGGWTVAAGGTTATLRTGAAAAGLDGAGAGEGVDAGSGVAALASSPIGA